MSVQKAYDSVIGRKEPDIIPVIEDASEVQSRVDWMQSNGTQRMIAGLIKDSNQLITDVIGLAMLNHQSDNSKQIVHKLIECNTLRKVVEKYAKVK